MYFIAVDPLNANVGYTPQEGDL